MVRHCCLVLFAAACLSEGVQLGRAQPPQFINNSGFEDPIDFNSWTVEHAFTGSHLICATNPATAHSGSRSAHFGAHEGQYDILSKHLATIPGLTYRVSFWLSSDNIAPSQDSFLVLWDNMPILSLNAPQNGFPYTLHTYDLVANSSSTELAFLGYKRFGAFRLDDAQTTFAPASDLCANAPRIIQGTWYGDNINATNDTQATCGLASGRDVWYRYIAECTNTLSLNTCGSSFDTTLSVWTGSCGALSQIGCNDDNQFTGPCPGGTTSYLTVPVVAGQTYYIRIAGFGSFSTGNYVLTVSEPTPANDVCADAPAAVLDGDYSGNTACADSEGSAGCASSGADVWYSYTPICNHSLQVSTCGSAYDTVLSVYTGDCSNLLEVACNDDGDGEGADPSRGKSGGGGCGLASSITLDVTAGNTYLIRVAGYLGATGQYSLSLTSLTPISNVTCNAAVPVGSGVTELRGTCVTGAGGWDCGPLGTPGFWYVYNSVCNGPVDIDFCSQSGATQAVLTVYHGPCGDLTCLDSALLNPASSCPQNTAALSFNAAAGSSYYICYTSPAGVNLAEATLTITPTPPANNDCASAIDVTTGTYFGATSCATTDAAASCGLSSQSPDVWYLWQAPCNGILQVDTCAPGYDTVLTVFGGACGSLVELACNDDNFFGCPVNTLSSRVETSVFGGEEYLIRVSGFNGSQGDFELHVTHTPAATNLACSQPAVIQDGSIEVDGRCATGTGARFCNGSFAWPGLWFSYTATCTGIHTFAFCESDGPHEVLLTVYSGTCGNLTCLDSRHRFGTLATCPDTENLMAIELVSGQTYLIAYTQFTGIPLGAGTITITQPGNESFEQLTDCMAGPNVPNQGCNTVDFLLHDFDNDGDIDMHDLAYFQQNFGQLCPP